MTKKTLKDPHAAREAANYENPVPSREYILSFLEAKKSPVTHLELCKQLSLDDEDSVEAMRRRLIAMTRDGQLICNRRGQYLSVNSVRLIKGRVLAHREGFGFVSPEDGSEDLFLSARQMRSVMHGDTVLVRVDDVDAKGRRIAVIVDILERGNETLVGRIYMESGVAFVTPDNAKLGGDVIVPLERTMGAKHGQYVVVEITQHPTLRTTAMGQVVEVLGDHMAPGMEIDVAIRSYSIPHVWPAEVLQEVARLSDEVNDADKQNRVDVRHLPFVTIDGEDARDFDDAVYCERKKTGGWRLYVAIADVAHYVKSGTALDSQAHVRGNSVYFPDHVVPMLPEKLSNGLCSLNPEVDRLCMICEMTISAQGALSGFQFYEGVMHSKARLTYTKVSRMLEHSDTEEGIALCERYSHLLPHLHDLYNMYRQLRLAREQRGAIDFETTETRIIFGADRKIQEIQPTERNEAHRLIEECMLCANVATARLLIKSETPALYRVHEGPTAEKLENLHAFLGELGLQLRGGESPSPSEYNDLLQRVVDRPDFNVIQTVMLRSLSQAVYSPEEKGHFGLAFPHYTHFTSPIRRYPDLVVHRAIKMLIHKGSENRHVVRAEALHPEVNRYQYDMAQMLQMGEHCSMTERRADEATRDVVNWLKCEFLQEHVGSTYEGVITAVTSFGFFVELNELFVEGLVHVSSLNSDYYHFDAVKHRLVGERTGSSYRLGDSVEVTVTRVDLDERKVDFEISGQPKRRRNRTDEFQSASSNRKPSKKNRDSAKSRLMSGMQRDVESGKAGAQPRKRGVSKSPDGRDVRNDERDSSGKKRPKKKPKTKKVSARKGKATKSKAPKKAKKSSG